jgi:hypothetical protein
MNKFTDPEGWPYPWPFADEVELWRIPKAERMAAVRYEKRRGTASVGTFADRMDRKRRLTEYLTEKKKEKETTGVNELKAEVENYAAEILEDYPERGEYVIPPYLYAKKERSIGFPRTFRRFAELEVNTTSEPLYRVPLGNKLEDYLCRDDDERFGKFDILREGMCHKLALRLDPRGTRKDAVTAFEKILEKMEESGEFTFCGEKRGIDPDKTDAALRNLAILRLRMYRCEYFSLPGFSKALKGTPFEITELKNPEIRGSEEVNNFLDRLRTFEKSLPKPPEKGPKTAKGVDVNLLPYSFDHCAQHTDPLLKDIGNLDMNAITKLINLWLPVYECFDNPTDAEHRLAKILKAILGIDIDAEPDFSRGTKPPPPAKAPPS